MNFGGYNTIAEPTPTDTITTEKDVGKTPTITGVTAEPTQLADSLRIVQQKNDPIDFYNGAYYFDHTDLAVGLSSGVRGLAFSRSYRSNRSNLDLAGLGPGWSHNYYARAFVRTSTDAAFGQSNPAAAATIVASLAIMQSILGDTPNLESVGKSAVIAKLALDQVLNNAIAIQLGEETHEFVRQADGSYVSPIRSTLTLTRAGDTLTLSQRHGDTYTFDLAAGGRLTRAVDPFGLEQLYSYTGDLLTTVRDAYGRTLTFGYHPGTNHISSVTDSTGRVTRYDYEQGNLACYTDPEGKATRYAYSGKLLTEIRDARDRLTLRSAYNSENAVDQQWNTGDPAKHYQYVFSAYRSAELNPLKGLDVTYYDARARPSRLVNALGEVTRYTYDGQNRPLTITNARGHTTTHTYNPDHTLATTTDPLGLTTLHTYDDYHRVLTTTLRDTDPATPDRVTTYTYIPGDTVTTRPETLTTPDGIRTRFAYYPSGGAIGQLYTSTQETALGNFTTTYEYDGYGQPTRVTAPDARVTRTTYDARGVLTDSYDAADTRTHYEYNLRRQPTLITAAYGTADASTVRTRYDDVGDPLETTDPTGIVTRYETNALGKVLSTTHAYGTALSRTSSTLYDVLDRPARDTDPTGRWTRYLYDAVGRRTAVVNSYQHAATILYDAVGQPAQTATPLQFTTKYTRDARGFATEETDPLGLTLYRTTDGYGAPATLKNRLGHTWTFHTDAAGRSTGLSTPLGYRQETRYNARGLPTPLIEPSLQETSFVYDAAGRPATRTDALGTLTYGYDAAGRPDRLTEGTAALRADHDLLGRVRTHTDARNQQIGYGYDAAGRLTTLRYPGGFSITYAYDVAGRLHTLTDSQGRVTRYRYDSADRLIETIRPNGTRRLQGYDAAGRLDYLHESDPANRSLLWRKFGYDADGRLTALRSLPVPQGFTETVPAAAYDADNRLTTWGGLSTAFDADGNLTTGPAPAAAGLASYGYDSRNRLTTTGQYSFGYDAADQRTTLTGPAGTTRYTIDPYGGGLPRVLVRERPDGSTTTYVYGHGLAYEIDSATGVRHYHGDHLGSTIALTDADGRLTDEVEYSPYGRITRRTGTTNTPFLYVGLAGVQTDPTGLLYMRARYYHPGIMRFVNADPIGFGGGMNWYAYANGNPVMFTDPNGLVAWGDLFSATLGIAGNGLGLATGFLLGIAPEPTLLTKVAAVAVVGKSSYGFGVSVQNAVAAIRDKPAVSKGSLANDVAELVAPGNQNAQYAATAIDLSSDLLLGRIGANHAQSLAGQTVRGANGFPLYDMQYQTVNNFQNLERVSNAFTAASVSQTIYDNFAAPLFEANMQFNFGENGNGGCRR
ncbi:MAG: DUF6531 domain-containing protein [Verrucomicrobia bacterium]|nr:DUF6531 domain-containing protein [Verrucomicrobiota bacterium]